MSDINKAQRQTLELFVDAPPTQPQGLPEAPSLEQVLAEAEILPLIVDDQTIRQLYAYFGAKSVDDLAESEWREFIRLANMSCAERAEFFRSKRTAPPAIAADLSGKATISLRDRAVELARQGFPVFPLVAGTKDQPAIPDWMDRPAKGEYFNEVPSSDPDRVYTMWTEASGNPLDYNIGICTNNFLVFDLDVKDGKNGIKVFAELVKEFGLRETTIATLTPTGGQHRVYKLPNGDKARLTVGALGEGVDTRGWNGYVVAPGSVVPAGEYKWLLSPEQGEMATATEAAMQRVRRAGRERQREAVEGLELDSLAAIERATEWLIDNAPEAIEGAGGDNQTFQIACVVRDFGVEEQTCLELMAEHWNDIKAHPPWPIDQLEQKVANAYSYAQNPIGAKSAEADFEAVELEVEPPTPEEKAKTKLFWRRFHESADRALQNSFDPLIEGYLERGGMSVLYGESGAGKTFVGLDMAYHIAAKQEWNGRKVKGGPVVYVAAEAGETINARMAALRARYKPEKEPPLCVVPCLLNLFNPGADLRELVELVHRWSELCGEKTVMIVLDTLARIIGSGDENTARDMGGLVQNIDKLRVATGAHVMVVHHSGKNKANGARGSSALRAATDTEIEVEGGRIKVRKQRATEEAKDVAFRLKSVVIGKKEGHDVTSCVVDKGAALDFEPLLTHEQQEWLEQVQKYVRMRSLTEFTHRDMQNAWASPPLQGGDHDLTPCPISTVKKRSTTLKQMATLEIVSESGEKPVRYKLSPSIATSSPP